MHERVGKSLQVLRGNLLARIIKSYSPQKLASSLLPVAKANFLRKQSPFLSIAPSFFCLLLISSRAGWDCASHVC
ncbi:hypothetical protein MRB53_034023 [Persea americana]|uniref:Uncharacterized protein n=1 Tax=Persea americana TaxID=3435 RepID=A0ACC2KWZ1_PERAE|nr:hypothetical protein MRB53_034023 [Persea americana]